MVPGTTHRRLPATNLCRLPGTTHSGLPGTTHHRLPDTTHHRLPGTSLHRLPGTTHHRLPDIDLRRLSNIYRSQNSVPCLINSCTQQPLSSIWCRHTDPSSLASAILDLSDSLFGLRHNTFLTWREIHLSVYQTMWNTNLWRITQKSSCILMLIFCYLLYYYLHYPSVYYFSALINDLYATLLWGIFFIVLVIIFKLLSTCV